RGLVRLVNDLLVVEAKPVEGRATLHGHAGRRHVAEGDGVVLTGDDRLGEVPTDLLGVHIEGGHELQVGDVIVPELYVHQPRHAFGRVGVTVILDTLDQRRGTVAH